MTARENLFLNPDEKWWHLLWARRETRTAAALLTEFDVRPPLPDQELSAFSGGNQQKIVLARWLSQARRLLVLAEPTVGVDVGAKSEIYGVLRRACSARETGVVMASSDFEEVALVADRALVLNPGGGAVVLEREQLSVDTVTAAAYVSRSLSAV
jgi:ribose transport system ATP-binding protein